MPTDPRQMPSAPVPVARVVRSGFTESVHYGSVVILGPDGQPALSVGDITSPIMPRSSNKPLQALTMLRHGLDLDGELLALVGSSHSGEAFHLDGVRRILASAGLDESALQNTRDLPLGEQERETWLAAGRAPSSLAQNCSGKHAGMLATCVVQGWSTQTYREPAHPLQVAIAACIAELADEKIAATGVDGCGAPVMAISLTGLARAFAAVAVGAAGTAEGRVAAAMRAYPDWVGGTGRDVTSLMHGIPGLIAKDGAEAVYAAALPSGVAVALKITDGGTRAAEVVMAEALQWAGATGEVLDQVGHIPVLGHGVPVGVVEAIPL